MEPTYFERWQPVRLCCLSTCIHPLHEDKIKQLVSRSCHTSFLFFILHVCLRASCAVTRASCVSVCVCFMSSLSVLMSVYWLISCWEIQLLWPQCDVSPVCVCVFVGLQVVHEAYTRFTEESITQSICDKTPDGTEVTIKVSDGTHRGKKGWNLNTWFWLADRTHDSSLVCRNLDISLHVKHFICTVCQQHTKLLPFNPVCITLSYWLIAVPKVSMRRAVRPVSSSTTVVFHETFGIVMIITGFSQTLMFIFWS